MFHCDLIDVHQIRWGTPDRLHEGIARSWSSGFDATRLVSSSCDEGKTDTSRSAIYRGPAASEHQSRYRVRVASDAAPTAAFWIRDTTA
jgi:hypothetical protein